MTSSFTSILSPILIVWTEKQLKVVVYANAFHKQRKSQKYIFVLLRDSFKQLNQPFKKVFCSQGAVWLPIELSCMFTDFCSWGNKNSSKQKKKRKKKEWTTWVEQWRACQCHVCVLEAQRYHWLHRERERNQWGNEVCGLGLLVQGFKDESQSKIYYFTLKKSKVNANQLVCII